MQKVLQLDARDNVLIALRDLKQNEAIEFSGEKYSLVSNIPAKHKFATKDLTAGSQVMMYGGLVGEKSKPGRRGELLSLSNIRHEAAEYHEKSEEFSWTPPDVGRWKVHKFLGYERPDGQVGTRNYWVVVPLVFCENRNVLNLKQAFDEELGFERPPVYRQQVAELARHYTEGRSTKFEPVHAAGNGEAPASQKIFKNVDGIRFLLHEGGCGGTREDSHNLCGLIAGYINHPNVAGATVLSLGCQNAQVDIFREQIQCRNPNFDKPLIVLEQQKSGSEFAMLSSAIRQTFQGLADANKLSREPADLSHLCVGLKCGGSDGFSGLSANPAIGQSSDLLAALGARTILAEFPELCGVEQELIDRAVNREVGDRFIHLM